jgi:hypothetical protein
MNRSVSSKVSDHTEYSVPCAGRVTRHEQRHLHDTHILACPGNWAAAVLRQVLTPQSARQSIQALLGNVLVAHHPAWQMRVVLRRGHGRCQNRSPTVHLAVMNTALQGQVPRGKFGYRWRPRSGFEYKLMEGSLQNCSSSHILFHTLSLLLPV